MYSYIKCDELVIDSAAKNGLLQLYENYMQHKFDLLGSGFIKMDYELQAKGVWGKRYRNPYMAEYGKKIEKKLKKFKKCSNTYKPINWFVDFKSGFFFHPKPYHSMISCRAVIGKKKGVDIKCPWELGRFYHLLQLAVYAVAEKKCREKVIAEFKDEVTDFMEVNPIGKTVQWSATMDTSIRMVNLLTAFDILRQLDSKKQLDNHFLYRFERHIYDSLNFVMEHLEFSRGVYSNHYLSNLAGIIFAASYLGSDAWTDACLVFGVQELIIQTQNQFYEEGTHFEGSTSYHRLSAEFVLYPTALIYGVLQTPRRKIFKEYDSRKIERLRRINNQKYHIENKDFFPAWYLDRIFNMGMFTKAILKENNEITQVGDNDSGRLIKLTPMCMAGSGEIKDNVIDHRTLLSAIGGLFENRELEKYTKELPLENSFIKALAGSVKLTGNLFDTSFLEYESEAGKRADYSRKPYRKETVIYQDNDKNDLLEGLKMYYYREFGILVFRSNRMFLSMVIDSSADMENMGHTHNDKLSIELMVDGQYITRDPGGYIYTSMPAIRDKFRSVNAHNTIHVAGKEQNILLGIWKMKRQVKAGLLYCSRECIIGKAEYSGVEHVREIKIGNSSIAVMDYSNSPFHVAFTNRIYSVGYGELKEETHDS